MSFTAVFIALLLERFFDCSHLRQWGWFASYQRLVADKFSSHSPAVLLAALIVPLILAVMVIDFAVYNTLFGFVKLVFTTLLLLYCFGPRNLWADIFASLNALTDGDKEAAVLKLKAAFDIDASANPQVEHRELVNRLFIQAHVRIFAIVFWYAILGVAGLVGYRLLSLINPEISSLAQKVRDWLDWLSSRALALLFTLGNRFNQVFTCWCKQASLGPEVNQAILIDCGMVALNHTEQDVLPVDGAVEKEAISLLDRSFIALLVVIAILVYSIP